jgi:predicted lipoprotein with Yx(FWY)xxD motif
MIHATTRTLFAAIAMSAAATTFAYATSPAQTAATSKGSALADTRGMTLYTFDKDSDGKSACNGPCAGNWPALKAGNGDSSVDGYTVITRDDGSKQWAYKGKPLYTFVKDQKPGDINGVGFLNGAWHLAKP